MTPEENVYPCSNYIKLANLGHYLDNIIVIVRWYYLYVVIIILYGRNLIHCADILSTIRDLKQQGG